MSELVRVVVSHDLDDARKYDGMPPHVTLAYFETSEGRAKGLITSIGIVATQHSPFSIGFSKKLYNFGPDGNILAHKVTNPDGSLIRVHGDLLDAAWLNEVPVDMGFQGSRYNPHLTVAEGFMAPTDSEVRGLSVYTRSLGGRALKQLNYFPFDEQD